MTLESSADGESVSVAEDSLPAPPLTAAQPPLPPRTEEAPSDVENDKENDDNIAGGGNEREPLTFADKVQTLTMINPDSGDQSTKATSGSGQCAAVEENSDEEDEYEYAEEPLCEI